MIHWRRQLPAYSPLVLSDVLVAMGKALRATPAATIGLAAEAVGREWDADRIVLCGSGTEALQLALGVAHRGFPSSPLVALPAFTCFAVAAAAVWAGARTVVYDVDPSTLAPEPGSLERALDAGARIVVVSPLFGIPIDWEAVAAPADSHGAFVIEDAAQGHGARWRGRPVGSFGRVSVLSFGRGKGWTGGSGGALLARGLTGPVASLNGRPGWWPEWKVAATTVAQWLFGRPALYRIPASLPWLELGESVYHDAGAPGGITSVGAALLERTHDRAAREVAGRRAHAEWFAARLHDVSHVGRVTVPLGGDAGWLRFPVRLPKGMAGFANPGHARRLGIEASYPTTLAELPPVRRLLSQPVARCPGAEELARTLVTLPTHSRLRPSDLDAIVGVLTHYGT